MHRAHTMPRQARTLHLHRACTLHAPQCTTSHRLRRRLGEGSPCPTRTPAGSGSRPWSSVNQYISLLLYLLRRRLGEGSFGIVYRSAVDGWRGATVAVKVLRTELTLILSLRLSLSPTLTLTLTLTKVLRTELTLTLILPSPLTFHLSPSPSPSPSP